MTTLLDLIAGARVFDLAQPWFAGMPHHPTHPPFLFGPVKQHGDFVGPAGHSSAADAIALGTHVGTHMDAFTHFSLDGRMRNEPIDTVAPVLRRGVLLDVAGLRGVTALGRDDEITPADLDAAAAAQGVEIRPGDVVLLRTGWAKYFTDAKKFISEVHGPGPAIGGARWLSGRGVYAAGADTVAFEKVPDAAMPVHVHLLVESGIHIIECLNLEELAASAVYEFVFVALPLKIRGATASPIRPVALA